MEKKIEIDITYYKKSNSISMSDTRDVRFVRSVLREISKIFHEHIRSIPRDGFTSLQVGIYDMFEIIFKHNHPYHNSDHEIVKMIIYVRDFILSKDTDITKMYDIGFELCRKAFNVDISDEYGYDIPEHSLMSKFYLGIKI